MVVLLNSHCLPGEVVLGVMLRGFVLLILFSLFTLSLSCQVSMPMFDFLVLKLFEFSKTIPSQVRVRVYGVPRMSLSYLLFLQCM